MIRKIILVLSATSFINVAYAALAIPIVMFDMNGQQKNIGMIKAEDSFCGVLLTPELHNLPAGVHGFHIHVNPSCDQNGMAAGGHLDPQKSERHNGPYDNEGHLGDLPVLIVDNDGTATLPTLAPRFKLDDLKGHAIMIHAGGDNYSDNPEKLGGGGARIACGVIK